MTPTLEALGIDRLSPDERIALAREILDSVIADRPGLSDAKRQELDRRWADHLANPDDVVSWDEVARDALARFGQ